MTDEKKQEQQDEKFSVEEVVGKAVLEFEKIQEAKDAKKAEEARIKELEEKAKELDELKNKEEEKKTWEQAKGTANVKKETKTGFSDEDTVMFEKYLRGEVSDNVAQKALEGGTGSEGGYLVPDEMWNQFTQLRDPLSWPRRAGCLQITASHDLINLPAESTSFTNFVIADEEAAYDTNDPAFAQNQVTIYKYTKLFKISEELVADSLFDIENILMQMIARSAAQTEAYYAAVGTGSSQPQGIFTGGGDTDALTFDSSGNITPDEIWELFYTLGGGYRPNAVWLMDDQTWRYVLSIRDANDWAWSAADMAKINVEGADGELLGKPVFLQDDIDEIAASTTVIAVGDPFYYTIVDRTGLSIQRLDELYAANGLIGYKCNFRQGMGTRYALSWVCGVMSA